LKPPEINQSKNQTRSQSENDSLKPLLAKDGEPLFDEPWQAEALAMADTLVNSGMFEAANWSETLGKHLRNAVSNREPDTSLTYYNAVLAALEELIAENSGIDPEDMHGKRKDWESAYLSTPHGQPVILNHE